MSFERKAPRQSASSSPGPRPAALPSSPRSRRPPATAAPASATLDVPYRIESVGAFTSEILQSLDNKSIRWLRKNFDSSESGKGLKLHEFVQVLQSFLRKSRADSEDATVSCIPSMSEEQLAANICELFSQVDVNGDGELEWDEFSSFVLEMGMSESGEGKAGFRSFKERHIVDNISRSALVSNTKYFPSLSMFSTMEAGGDAVRLYNSNCRLQRTIKFDPALHIQCVEHVPHTQQLVISTGTPLLLFIDDNSSGMQTIAPTTIPTHFSMSPREHASDVEQPPHSDTSTAKSATADSRPEDPVIDPALELSLTVGLHAVAGRSVLAELQARAQHLATAFALDQKRATEAEAHKSAHAHAHTHAHAHAPHVREFQSFAVSRKTIRALTPAVPQLCLAAYQPGGLLFSGGVDGVATGWDPVNLEEVVKMTSLQKRTSPHVVPTHPSIRSPRRTANVRALALESPRWMQARQTGSTPSDPLRSLAMLDIIAVPDIDAVCTGSFDGIVRLWDVRTGASRREFRGHTQGVRTLSYSHAHKVLLSAGFDNDVCVWNTFLDKAVFTLRGHMAPLVRVIAPDDKPLVFSADSSGIIKIWDIRTFQCVDTLNKSSAGPLGDVVWVPGSHTLVGAGHSLFAFDTTSLMQPTLADDDNVSLCVYNATSGTFTTAAGTNVKIWDASSGCLLRSFDNVSAHSITCLLLDDRERKFIAADHSGNMQVFDFVNGSLMKSGRVHAREVCVALYLDSDKVVLSCSWDRSIAITDETDPHKCVVLKRVENAHDSDITALAFNLELSLIASGDANGLLHVWDSEFLKHEGTCVGHTNPIRALVFLAPYPLLASSDACGNVAVWCVRGSASPCHLLCRIVNTSTLLPSLPFLAKYSALAVSPVATPRRHSEEAAASRQHGTPVADGVIALGISTKWSAPCTCSSTPAGTIEGFTMSTVHTEACDGAGSTADGVDSPPGDATDPSPGVLSCVGQCGRDVIEMNLFMGDERGRVKVAWLMPFLQACKSILVLPLREAVVRRYPRRLVSADFASFHKLSAMNPAFVAYRDSVARQSNFHMQKAPMLESKTLLSCIRSSWSAHPQAISSLQVIPHPETLVTCSLDRRVCVWSWTGKCLGSLKQSNRVEPHADHVHTLTPTDWLFKPSLQARYEELRVTAMKATVDASMSPRISELIHSSTTQLHGIGSYAYGLRAGPGALESGAKAKSEASSPRGALAVPPLRLPAHAHIPTAASSTRRRQVYEGAGIRASSELTGQKPAPRRTAEFDVSAMLQLEANLHVTTHLDALVADSMKTGEDDEIALVRTVKAIPPITPRNAGRPGNLVHAGIQRRIREAASSQAKPKT